MGIFDIFSSVGDWIVDKIDDGINWVAGKVEDAVDWVKDKLKRKKYDEFSIEDHIDVDATLADFRKSIQDDVCALEKKCMNSVSSLFSDLKEKTKETFPDLIKMIDMKQEEAEYELEGTIMKYVKEHISKNDTQFVKILKMHPGQAKDIALDNVFSRVLENAEIVFNAKLKTYAEYLLEEFSTRLKSKIESQEEQMRKKIEKLEELIQEAENGSIDVDSLRDNSLPQMEAAQSILILLEQEDK